MTTISITASVHERIMDRRDSKLKSANDVVRYALDCMDKLEQTQSECAHYWAKFLKTKDHRCVKCGLVQDRDPKSMDIDNRYVTEG